MSPALPLAIRDTPSNEALKPVNACPPSRREVSRKRTGARAAARSSNSATSPSAVAAAILPRRPRQGRLAKRKEKEEKGTEPPRGQEDRGPAGPPANGPHQLLGAAGAEKATSCSARRAPVALASSHESTAVGLSPSQYSMS